MGLLRAVMLWYYMKRPGICQDYSGLWCYDIIWSDQVYVGITPGGDVMILYEATRYMSGLLGLWCYDIIWSDQVYVGITPGCDVMILYEATRYMSGLLRAVMLWYYMKRPGICRDYSGVMLWYYMKRPGICRDYSGRWCYDIIWSDQVYVGITPGGDVIASEVPWYMKGLGWWSWNI